MYADVSCEQEEKLFSEEAPPSALFNSYYVLFKPGKCGATTALQIGIHVSFVNIVSKSNLLVR